MFEHAQILRYCLSSGLAVRVTLTGVSLGSLGESENESLLGYSAVATDKIPSNTPTFNKIYYKIHL
jgi:hypothetical protein